LDEPRRIVAKLEHHTGELFPRVGFIVTNLRLASRAVVPLCRSIIGAARRIVDQRMRAGSALDAAVRHRFRANEVRLQLSVLAFNFSNGGGWSAKAETQDR
jgi:hypothetical protein